MSGSFTLIKRNTKRWDVWASGERIFRIRGRGCEGTDKDGAFCVIGEHSFRGVNADGFETLTTATAYGLQLDLRWL